MSLDSSEVFECLEADQQLTIYAHDRFSDNVQFGDICIDATVGNGYDTCKLAHLTGKDGQVYGFDIQIEAIEATRYRLYREGLLTQVNLINGDHARLSDYIPEKHRHHVKLVCFNLGYLPGGDKSITTRTDSTLAALNQSLDYLAEDGLVSILCYKGHQEGALETKAVLDWCKQLLRGDYSLRRITVPQAKNEPPELLLIHKME